MEQSCRSPKEKEDLTLWRSLGKVIVDSSAVHIAGLPTSRAKFYQSALAYLGVGGGGSVFRVNGLVLSLALEHEMCHNCLISSLVRKPKTVTISCLGSSKWPLVQVAIIAPPVHTPNEASSYSLVDSMTLPSSRVHNSARCSVVWRATSFFNK